MLTQSAYADDKHLRAAVRELRRIVRPGGTVLASTNSNSTLGEVHDLLHHAVSEAVGRPVHALPALSFTTATGAVLLEGEFSSVTLHRHEVMLAFPSAQPVVDYFNSIREPIERLVGEPFGFDAVLGGIATRVEQVIRAQGCFRTASRSGVFVCR